MNALIHQIIQRRINQAVSLQWELAGKGGADDAHVEVTLALVGMTGVLVALVQHLKRGRLQRLLQAFTDLLDHCLTHAGKAFRNGLIRTSA